MKKVCVLPILLLVSCFLAVLGISACSIAFNQDMANPGVVSDSRAVATGNFQRMAASNFPNSYIRHQNSIGRIDAGVNPFEDSAFKCVAGLKDASYVSFQSVNFPGSYLRHQNSAIVLSANDGTDLFKQDATFKKVAGLANSAYTSYQSYNFPAQYIRHQNSILRISAISTDLDKADSTFIEKQMPTWSWVKGCVFVPSNAVNECQQWEEYNSAINDRELRYARVYGINLVRVYLSFIYWQKNSTQFLANIENFLQLANKHGIKTEFVFFDDCWNPTPSLAPYPGPVYGVHNSRWQQIPGDTVKNNFSTYSSQLQGYIQGIVNAHKADSRIAFWETYNEPSSAASPTLMSNAYNWIKATGSTIPVNATGGGFLGDPYSDFHAWHMYGGYNGGTTNSAPSLCTEAMNRDGQTVPGVVSYFAGKTGYILWELMIGRDNCRFPWANNSSNPATSEPATPFHGVVYPDGHPWSLADVQAIAGNNLSSAPVFNVTYYTGNFATSRKTSITPMIDFDLGNEKGTGSPDATAGIPIDGFSIQWTGKVVPSSTGTYTFYAKSDNTASITIGSTTVVSKTASGLSESSGAIALTAGTSYPVNIRYYHASGNASMHVNWSGPNMSKQVLQGAR
jgi:hypothetical protein